VHFIGAAFIQTLSGGWNPQILHGLIATQNRGGGAGGKD
jgi:hypothetical protein